MDGFREKRNGVIYWLAYGAVCVVIYWCSKNRCIFVLNLSSTIQGFCKGFVSFIHSSEGASNALTTDHD